MNDKIYLKMDCEAWLGAFRSPSTVTTQITHVIPPKSTIIGILLAKVGFIRNYDAILPKEYLVLQKDVKVAIKYSLSNRYIDYVVFKNMLKKERKPTFIEYLVRPKYSFIIEIPKSNEFLGEKNLSKLLSRYEFFKMYLGKNECPIIDYRIEQIYPKECLKKEIFSSYVVDRDLVDSVAYNDKVDFLYDSVNFFSYISNKQPLSFIVPLTKTKFILKKELKCYNYNGEDIVVV